MTDKPRMDFGYNPPTGERSLETIRPREYLSDLHRSLDVASQSFSSLWISDHINYGSEFRMECWTLLTWIAGPVPGAEAGHYRDVELVPQPIDDGEDGRDASALQLGPVHPWLRGGLA